MSRRNAVILGVLVVALAVGLEWAFRFGKAGRGLRAAAPSSSMRAAQPMEGLVASFADTKVNLGTLASGEKAKVWFSGAGRERSTLQIHAAGEPDEGFHDRRVQPDGAYAAMVLGWSWSSKTIKSSATLKRTGVSKHLHGCTTG